MELKNSDWYEIARDTNWTPKYVTEDELFPPQFSDPTAFPFPRGRRSTSRTRSPIAST